MTDETNKHPWGTIVARILVALRHFQGSSSFGPFSLGYAYDIAIPLEPVPEVMAGDAKYSEHANDGAAYFEFSKTEVGGRATSDILPGYVCAGGWYHWSPAWLCLTDNGYVFEPFLPDPPPQLKPTLHERLGHPR